MKEARTFLLLPLDPLSLLFFELGSVFGSPLRLEDSDSFVGTPTTTTKYKMYVLEVPHHENISMNNRWNHVVTTRDLTCAAEQLERVKLSPVGFSLIALFNLKQVHLKKQVY